MSAQFYVRDAQQKVTAIRQRLAPTGLFQDLESAIAITDFAALAGECTIVALPELSENRGLAYLADTYGLRIGDHSPSDLPLAGALCVAENAAYRWILLRAEDNPRRQRFTIAHELGHLFLEVEPAMHVIGQRSLEIDSRSSDSKTVRMFSRCATVEAAASDALRPLRTPLSPSELLEVKADHFASELLMPYDGVRRLVQRSVACTGVRTARELGGIAAEIADRYDVSAAAARRRLEKDLAIVPIEDHPNGDLFS